MKDTELIKIGNTSKGLLRSKTFWLQLVTLAAAFLPGVQDWLARNPVEPIAVLVAINIIVRFATSGAVTLFESRDGDSESHDDEGNDGRGGGSGGIPLLLIVAAAGCLGALPSCSSVGYPVGVAVQGPGYTVSYQFAK